jgi:hypothetical protein
LTQTARVFKVNNALAKVVRLPGGRTVAEALHAADTRIGRMKDVCVAAMQQRIAKLAALADEGRAGKDGLLGDIHTAGNEILGLAGAFGMTELGDAAYSLCDLADAFRESGVASWPAIDVHVHGLRLLCAETGDEADRRKILDGLKLVRARFIAPAEVRPT